MSIGDYMGDGSAADVVSGIENLARAALAGNKEIPAMLGEMDQILAEARESGLDPLIIGCLVGLITRDTCRPEVPSEYILGCIAASIGMR